MAVNKVPVNSPCPKSPTGYHDWRSGKDFNGRIHTWCHHCGSIPK